MSCYLLKTSVEVLDYEFDWTAELSTSPADSISTSTWVVMHGSVAVDSNTKTTFTAKVWLSGGVNGGVAYVVNRIVTVGGRTEEKLLVLRIKDA